VPLKTCLKTKKCAKIAKKAVSVAHNYPSDITREQFEIIRPDLEIGLLHSVVKA